MIEYHSHKIQNAIQKELFKAQSSIRIAVAWFTNDLLFQPLLLKLSTGVKVEIILNKDNINCSKENEIDFDRFVEYGGVLRWNTTKQLLHDKFCIIDDNVVIAGSYNWTKKQNTMKNLLLFLKMKVVRVNSIWIDFKNYLVDILKNVMRILKSIE